MQDSSLLLAPLFFLSCYTNTVADCVSHLINMITLVSRSMINEDLNKLPKKVTK